MLDNSGPLKVLDELAAQSVQSAEAASRRPPASPARRARSIPMPAISVTMALVLRYC